MNLNAQIPGCKIGSFDQFSDIGLPKIPGQQVISEPSQTYHLTGPVPISGLARIAFHFFRKKMNGDFIIQTQVRFLGEGHEPHRKAGLMIRSSAATNSPVVACTVHGDGLTALQYRTTAG